MARLFRKGADRDFELWCVIIIMGLIGDGIRGERFSSRENRSPLKSNRGQLLIEILLAISVTAIVISLGAQMTFVSLKSNKLTGERDTATALMREELEAIRAASHEDWFNLYNLARSPTQNYASENMATARWTLAAGSDATTTDLVVFTRYFVVDNVSRDGTGAIEATYNSSNDDPSTQIVTATVSWAGGSVSNVEYFSRWRNKACYQTDWAGGAGQTGGTGQVCPTTAYDTASSTVNTAAGSLQLQ
jgi:hypothetical protein